MELAHKMRVKASTRAAAAALAGAKRVGYVRIDRTGEEFPIYAKQNERPVYCIGEPAKFYVSSGYAYKCPGKWWCETEQGAYITFT